MRWVRWLVLLSVLLTGCATSLPAPHVRHVTINGVDPCQVPVTDTGAQLIADINACIAAAGGGTPGGTTGQIQYNNAGAFAGAAIAAHQIIVGEGALAPIGVALGGDTLLQGVASADPTSVSVPNCGDTGGNHLNYSTSTHLFTCGTSSSGGGGSGTVNSGTGPAIAQYVSGTGTVVGPATVSGDSTVAQGGAWTNLGLHFGASNAVSLPGSAPTSGGVPYFSSTSALASSALLSANNPIIGGGAGVAPSSGARSGNTTTFGTTSGSLTSGNLAKFDASGNLIDSGLNSASGGGIDGYSSTAVAFTGTQYFPIHGGGAPSGTEANVDLPAPKAATVTNFFVELSAAPGIGNNIVFTFRDAGSDTSVTCTILGGSATSCNDTTHSFTPAQADALAVKAVTTGAVGTPNLVFGYQFGTTGGNGTVNSGTTGQTAYYAAGGTTVSGVGPGTTTTVLHGNGAGPPSFGAVSLTTDVSGVLPAANGGANWGRISDGGFATGATPGNDSQVITKPSGIANNDGLITCISYNTGNSPTTLAGWTSITSVNNGAGNVALQCYSKLASSEGASYTWTVTGGVSTSAMTYFVGNTAGTFVDNSTTASGNSALAQVPTVAASNDGEAELYACGMNQAFATNPPIGTYVLNGSGFELGGINFVNAVNYGIAMGWLPRGRASTLAFQPTFPQASGFWGCIAITIK